MKTKNKRKIIILLSLYLVLLFSPKNKEEKNIEFLTQGIYQTTTYSKGKVYITTCDNIETLYNEESDDIYVLDQRTLNNPNMEILNSYRITSKSQIEELIKILLKYEELYPSSWNRSYYSLLNEWQIHNICYKYNYDEESTRHVDLDNKDEKKYNIDELTMLLGNK